MNTFTVAGATPRDTEGTVIHLAPQAARAPAILVVGGCGGAGATTTALGLAAAAAGLRLRTVAVDATGSGGDLGLRGADFRLAPTTIQTWLEAADAGTLGSIDASMSWTTAGAGVLWRDETPLRRRTTYATAQRILVAAGYTPVFDGGHPVASEQLRPLLLDNRVRVVMTVPARVDAANRMRASLQWIDDHVGPDLLTSTTLLVSHQHPNAPSVASTLRKHLRGYVRDVAEIPFDRHLASGLAITHGELSSWTQRAYSRLLQEVWSA